MAAGVPPNGVDVGPGNTRIMVAADVVVAPLLSTATAVMAWFPTGAFVQFS
jgi:hypothetical protein